MPFPIDAQLRERMEHGPAGFPVTFFEDEFSIVENRTIPLHWHPEFEIDTAVNSALDFQVGQLHLKLEAGESILINGNMLHGMSQTEGGPPDPMPNIVFSGTAIAAESAAIYQKYIRPVASCDSLPFFIIRNEILWQRTINDQLLDLYQQMRECGPCYEMAIQRILSQIFETLFLHFDELPCVEATRFQIGSQIRLQKMLTFIHTHYAETVTLEAIAASAAISRSEANRCFHTYMDCSPVDALIQYRLQVAHTLLGDAALTLGEISRACGFNSESYFSRRFRRRYGYAPGERRNLGK